MCLSHLCVRVLFLPQQWAKTDPFWQQSLFNCDKCSIITVFCLLQNCYNSFKVWLHVTLFLTCVRHLLSYVERTKSDLRKQHYKRVHLQIRHLTRVQQITQIPKNRQNHYHRKTFKSLQQFLQAAGKLFFPTHFIVADKRAVIFIHFPFASKTAIRKMSVTCQVQQKNLFFLFMSLMTRKFTNGYLCSNEIGSSEPSHLINLIQGNINRG